MTAEEGIDVLQEAPFGELWVVRNDRTQFESRFVRHGTIEVRSV